MRLLSPILTYQASCFATWYRWRVSKSSAGLPKSSADVSFSCSKKSERKKKMTRIPSKKKLQPCRGHGFSFFFDGIRVIFFSVPIFLGTKRTRAASDFSNPAEDFATCHQYQVASDSPDTYRI